MSRIRRHQATVRAALERVLLVVLAAPGCTSGDGAATADASASIDAPGRCDFSDAYVIDAPYVMSGGVNCFYFIDLPCGASIPAANQDCFLGGADCARLCTLEAGAFDCEYFSGCVDGGATGGPATVGCDVCPGVGRRPRGLRATGRRKTDASLGAHLARAAHLEAASVLAFERLARELDAHGAPGELVRAAQRSAVDEVRHARTTARLSRQHGGSPLVARVVEQRVRTLGRVAVENAVEGCVRETYGAAVAAWQAEHATRPELRAAMTTIARDEARHAALAWAVDAWAQAKLDARARRRVARAAWVAIDQVAREAAAPVPPSLVREAGLPDATDARAIVRRLRVELWSRTGPAAPPSSAR